MGYACTRCRQERAIEDGKLCDTCVQISNNRFCLVTMDRYYEILGRIDLIRLSSRDVKYYADIIDRAVEQLSYFRSIDPMTNNIKNVTDIASIRCTNCNKPRGSDQVCPHCTTLPIHGYCIITSATYEALCGNLFKLIDSGFAEENMGLIEESMKILKERCII